MTSPGGVLAASAVWLVLLCGPGAIVVGRRSAHHWAAVIGAGPLLTLACLGLLRGTSELTGVAVHPVTVLLLLGAAGVAGRRIRHGRHVGLPGGSGSLGLLCVVVASLAVWLMVSTSGRITLGGIDGPRHAFFVSRILEGDGAAASIVLRHDAAVAEPVSNYYPLSVHVGTATVQQLTGLSTADTINGLGVVMCAAVLPCGWWWWTRRWLTDVGSVLAAAIAAFGSLWPWFGWSLGWLPYVTGMVAVPGAMALAEAGLRQRRAWPLTAVAAGAMIATHTGALCVFLACSTALALGAPDRRRSLARLAVGAGFGAVAVVPETWSMVTGVLERRTVASATPGVQVAEALSWSLGRFSGSPVSVPLVALAVIGVAVSRGRHRAVAVVPLLMAALAVAVAAHDEGVVHFLAAPWNADIERLVLTTYGLLPPFAAAALVRAIGLARTHGQLWSGAVVATSTAVAVAATSTALDGVRFLDRTPSESTQQVLERAASVDGGRVLAGYPYDGGLWLASLEGPDPAFGWPPEFVDQPASWVERLRLAALVAAPDSDAREVTALARRLCVRAVLAVDEARKADPTYPFDRERMRRAAFLDEVVAEQDASLFVIEGTESMECPQ